MAPSLRTVGAAALACVGSVSAKQWYLADTYDATNFFDKFTFFSDADPNSGHVVYKSLSEATSLGLAKYEDDQVYLGPDSTNVLDEDTGRPSVRLHSASSFNHGLFIARFSHLPQAACGSWPAFWTVGNTWPDDGEIDIIEGWNLQTTNAPAFHTGDSDEFGTCKLDGASQSATVDTSNCDNTYSDDSQSLNQGCTGTDSAAPYGSSDGGVYALEWTDSYIKLFAWTWDNIPDNLDSDEPDTGSWGEANMYLKNDNCDIDNHFIDQTLIINIAFCGNPVGNDDVWAAACSSKTGYDTCNAYVSAVPTDFANTYFKIKDIRYFKTTKSASSSSSSSSAVDSASTPAATPASTRVNNGTLPVVTATTAGSDSGSEMTTSVVYTTQTHTVTSCASTVTNCPVGSVVTKTVALYTTVCPVTAAEATSTGASSGSGSDSSPAVSSSGFWPAPAPSASGVQTPGADETPAAGEAPVETPVETPVAGSTPIATPPAGGYTTIINSVYTPIATSTPTPTPGAATSGSSGSTQSEVPVTGGAAKMGASFALVLGAIAAMMI